VRGVVVLASVKHLSGAAMSVRVRPPTCALAWALRVIAGLPVSSLHLGSPVDVSAGSLQWRQPIG